MHPEVETLKQAETNEDNSAKTKGTENVVEAVERAENGNANGSTGEMNGNGIKKCESGDVSHSVLHASLEDGEILSDASAANGNDSLTIKSPNLRQKGARRLSTSSHSSVASVPSGKANSGLALQMEVSMEDGELLDNMEPLIIQGTAEDLEVSVSAPLDSSNAPEKDVNNHSIIDIDSVQLAIEAKEWETKDGLIQVTGTSTRKTLKKPLMKKVKALKQSAKRTKLPKVARDEQKIKAIRSKSPKLEKTSTVVIHDHTELPGSDDDDSSAEDELPLSQIPVKKAKALATPDETLEEPSPPTKSPARGGKPSKLDQVKDDASEADKSDSELCDHEPVSPVKSPTRSGRLLKPDLLKDETSEAEKSDSESGPRRSSRSRQTPQKYTSVVLECGVDSPLIKEAESFNKSDAGYAVSVRSVRGRKPLRKSRNMSALNASLHNESSPWEDFKVLTPSGEALSPHTSVINTPTSAKRKVPVDDEGDDENEPKKMCTASSDADASFSSQTSSFFSIVTSPINLLKGKLRGSVSCSTPFSRGEKKFDGLSEDDSMMISANENEGPAAKESDGTPTDMPQEVPVEGKGWCTIM